MKAFTMVAIYTAYVHITELMIMAEHHTFSRQTDQIKFGCTYVLYYYTVFIRMKAGLIYTQGLKYTPGSAAE